MRKPLSILIIVFIMVASLTACNSSSQEPAEKPYPESSDFNSLAETTTSDPSDPTNPNPFKTVTVTLGTVEFRPGDRLIKLIDAGWIVRDDELNFEDSADDLTFYYVELEHVDYPNTYLNVSLDSFDSKPGELIADAYIERFHMLCHAGVDKKIDVPWSIGGVIDNTYSLEDTFAAFPNAEKDVTMYNDEMLSTKFDLDSYCEGTAFSAIRLDWWGPSDTYESFAVGFDLDALDTN